MTPARPGFNGRENRTSTRYPTMIRGYAQGKAGGTQSFEVVASNVSEGGLLLHTNHGAPLAEGDLLTLTFMPLLAGKLIVVKGAIAWVADAAAPALGRRSFGLAFLGANPDAVERLIAPAREAARSKLAFDRPPDPLSAVPHLHKSP